MAKAASLSVEDIARLKDDLAEGRPAAVWFTPAAVGVTAGRSAKVVAFDDAAEGDFIQVRATGSQDVLSFSPSELTVVKPPRVPKPVKPAQPVVAAVPERPEAPTPIEEHRYEPEQPAPAKRAPRRAVARSAAVTVTLMSTENGEWTVEVRSGDRRKVRPTPVPAGAVAKAARSLPDTVGEAIEASLDAARAQQQSKIELLKAELEAAQRALRELSG